VKNVIIGGGGFLGSHLSEVLLANGQDVIVFDRPDARYLEFSRQRGAKIVIGDFLNPVDIRHAIINCDVVYHLVSATVPKISNDDPSFDVQANVIGTLQLLIEMSNARVPKIVFASSGGTVYGDPQEIPIKESHPTDPTCSYGICKLTIEKYLHLFWLLNGMDYRIARISNAYGERQPVTGTQGVIANFMDKALRNEEIVIWGDGSIIRDYIHASDIANALMMISRHEGDPKIYNIGFGHGRSLIDIIDIIQNITHRELRRKLLPSRPFDVKKNILDISRAKIYLNWQPEVDLQAGISRLYEWIVEEKP
jgi:UDP-glucose 4-epimerase